MSWIGRALGLDNPDLIEAWGQHLPGFAVNLPQLIATERPGEPSPTPFRYRIVMGALEVLVQETALSIPVGEYRAHSLLQVERISLKPDLRPRAPDYALVGSQVLVPHYQAALRNPTEWPEAVIGAARALLEQARKNQEWRK